MDNEGDGRDEARMRDLAIGPSNSPPFARFRRVRRELVGFFLSTLLGLSIDLGLFAWGVAAGLMPGLANLLSSACAVTVMYFLSSRLTFRSAQTTSRFVLFVMWYVASIMVFSLLVQVAHDTFAVEAFWAKLLTLPLSFAANFVAVRLIMTYRVRNLGRST
ncbi:GtrA family protein [Cryobacterium sp. 1639]|uniref:GtrA family protein n=1 Tax=Cryobacterium inferilacus TaxID=2866629 RepID=UPI001C72E166|nr:GtrA family protein [Cryobacterium sp. 1639]MBX0301942.1 GtrA family protein [Cryobacterium sp. 1639]